MVSKATFFFAFLLSFNLLFFVSANCNNCNVPAPPKPNPCPTTPKPSPSSGYGKCPLDTVKLGVCAKLLEGLLDVTIGKPPVAPCCSLIEGLADLEAAVCLCTAIKAGVLGNKLNVPVSLTLLLIVCNKNVPKGFHC